jgi:hypothetical protein
MTISNSVPVLSVWQISRNVVRERLMFICPVSELPKYPGLQSRFSVNCHK